MDNINYDFYYTKQLIAICFSKEAKKYFIKANLTNEYLGFLYEKIVLNDTFYILNEQMKYNLLDLTNYIRFNCKLLNIEIQALNDIIIKINSTPISFYPYQCYLAEEFDIRFPDGKIELNFLDDIQIEELLENIEFDFVVLNSLLCPEDEYHDIIIDDLTLNEFYFCSINKLITEIPDLIKEKSSRIKDVIAVNNLYRSRKKKNDIENYNAKDFRIVIKSGNKLLKKMNK